MDELKEQAAQAGIELPQLSDTVIDEQTVDALFVDITACTQLLEVIVKRAAGYVGDDRVSLDEARQLISDGAVRGVQIRYVYDGAQWWDTLMLTPAGIRIVRIRHDVQNIATQ